MRICCDPEITGTTIRSNGKGDLSTTGRTGENKRSQTFQKGQTETGDTRVYES